MTSIANASSFSPTITSGWNANFADGEVLYCGADLTVVANAKLDADRRAMVWRAAGGAVHAAVTPAVADQLGLHQLTHTLTEPLLRERLATNRVQLHGADYVFHFTESDRQALVQEQPPINVRQLHAGKDAAVFAAFQSSATEQDLDDAYVELDHWAVFGAFDEQGSLVCAASMYPWDGQKIADLGVLTLPPHRGRGHAAKVVRAISRYACAQGYEPQYRCQLDNGASVALAKAAGFTLFGTLEVVSPET
jgi:RimJ/RimL family protein N-acetyltransferase